MALDFLFQGQPTPNATSMETVEQGYPKFWLEYIQKLMSKGSSIAGEPYKPAWTGQRVAGFNQDQQNAFNMTRQGIGNWQPAQQSATDLTTQGATGSSLGAANPMLTDAATRTSDLVGGYMSPYTQNVVDKIADQGVRNLNEKILPGISDSFIKAGSYGGSRMGDITGRALRDTQEAVLAEQARAMESGFNTSLKAAGDDQARIAGIGTTQGNLAGQDFGRMITGGQNMGNLAAQQQQLGIKDAAALEAVGTTQQNLAQKDLEFQQAQAREERDNPQQMAYFMNSIIRGMQPPTTTTTTSTGPANASQMQQSPLTQLASLGTGIYGASKAGLFNKGGRVKGIGYADGGYVSSYADGGDVAKPGVVETLADAGRAYVGMAGKMLEGDPDAAGAIVRRHQRRYDIKDALLGGEPNSLDVAAARGEAAIEAFAAGHLEEAGFTREDIEAFIKTFGREEAMRVFRQAKMKANAAAGGVSLDRPQPPAAMQPQAPMSPEGPRRFGEVLDDAGFPFKRGGSTFRGIGRQMVKRPAAPVRRGIGAAA